MCGERGLNPIAAYVGGGGSGKHVLVQMPLSGLNAVFIWTCNARYSISLHGLMCYKPDQRCKKNQHLMLKTYLDQFDIFIPFCANINLNNFAIFT